MRLFRHGFESELLAVIRGYESGLFSRNSFGIQIYI
jgi:hypothetical protein